MGERRGACCASLSRGKKRRGQQEGGPGDRGRNLITVVASRRDGLHKLKGREEGVQALSLEVPGARLEERSAKAQGRVLGHGAALRRGQGHLGRTEGGRE